MLERESGGTKRRRTVRPLRVILAATIGLLVVLAGYAVYDLVLYPPGGGPTTLVVYSYPSLLGGCGGSVVSGLLAEYQQTYGVHVDLECPSGTLVATLLAQKNAPVADVVVGLDEITAPQAESAGLLIPYAPPALADVNTSLSLELSVDHGVTPYEWGYLGFDYNLSFARATGDAVAHTTFADFSTNHTWASSLMVEDPTTDITGEEFLLWEIAYSLHVARDNWQTWWQEVDPYVAVAPDWGSAYAAFTTPPNSPALVVSYSTDPAAQAYYGGPDSFNTSVAWANGTAYGWKTVYGLGIVQGTHHLAAAQEFVNWFLSAHVQNQIPTNEWEYPANTTIPLPGVFNYSLDPSAIVPLNSYLSPSTIVASLPGWLDAWQTMENQAG